jgi:hypothetical protein
MVPHFGALHGCPLSAWFRFKLRADSGGPPPRIHSGIQGSPLLPPGKLLLSSLLVQIP